MKIFITLMAFCFQAQLVFAGAPVNDELRDIVENIRQQKHNAGLAIAVFSANEITHLSTHGYADVDTKRPVTENSIFMIGSTTKAMTATVAGYLVDEGKLAWDDTVKKWIPAFDLMDKDAATQATLRDLLLHRTGLPRHDLVWYTQPGLNSSELVQRLALLEFSAPFRSKWQYNNLMYMAAGLVAASAGGRSWDELVEEKIFKNLGMTNTRALTSKVTSSDDQAMPHNWDGQALTRIPYHNIDAVGPAGAVHSSILDMVKWAQFNLNKGQVAHGKSLSLAAMNEIHRPQISRGSRSPWPEFESENLYSFAWNTSKYRGATLVGHGGSIDGFTTSVYFIPERDVGVVVLTNGGDLAPDIVALTALDYAIGAERVDWLERSNQPSGPNDKFPTDVTFPDSYEAAEGSFSHPAYGTFTVKQILSGERKVLNLSLNGFVPMNVLPWLSRTPNEWVFDYARIKLTLHLSESGSVDWIAVNVEPTTAPVRFERVHEAMGPRVTNSRLSFCDFYSVVAERCLSL